MAAQTFTLTNSGDSASLLDKIVFDTPSGLAHTADMTNFGGSATFSDATFTVVTQKLEPGQSKTFTVDYMYVSGAVGTKTGSVAAFYVGGQTCAAQTTIEVAAPPAPPPPPPPPAPPVPAPTPGTENFSFDADYIMMKTTFTDGRDLDIRVRAVSPSGIGTTYLGWGTSGAEGDWLLWGGDNTGLGSEAVLFDTAKFKAAHPNVTEVKIDFRCFWFGSAGSNPVSLAMVLWKGGTPTLSTNRTWDNSGATNTQNITSAGQVITTSSQSVTTTGQRLAVLTYNFTTKVGSIDITDTTTYTST